jgi:ABC-type bacteriocin/lantibiotic exporter with double-glycine peptidase domain
MARMAALPGFSVRRSRRVRSISCILLALTALASFTGCAERDFSALRSGIEQRGHYITGVPFYRQGEDSCGPAALASVISFWGQQVNMEQIKVRVYLPELRGTLPMDMERFLHERGFRTISSAGTLAELKKRVRDNVPVICLLDLGFSLYRRPHYVTVIGFDDMDGVLIVHDGMNANKVIGYAKFMKEWGRAGNWMLIALKETQPSEDKR